MQDWLVHGRVGGSCVGRVLWLLLAAVRIGVGWETWSVRLVGRGEGVCYLVLELSPELVEKSVPCLFVVEVSLGCEKGRGNCEGKEKFLLC